MDWTKEKEQITITAPALTLLAVHGNLLLSLRHPANNGPSRKLVIEFIDMIEKKLIEVGLLDTLTVFISKKVEEEESPHEEETFETPDAEMLRMMLELVDIQDMDVPFTVIENWSEKERKQVADWISAVHLKASDNDDIEVPPVPEVLKQYTPD